MKRVGKYTDFGQGRNWIAVIKPSYGMSVDRNFLPYGEGVWAYDFGIVESGSIIEIAYDYRIGGSHPNRRKSNDYVKNREFFLVMSISDENVTMVGGFPDYDGILAYKAKLEDAMDENRAREGEYPFPS